MMLVDAGPLIAIVDRADACHEECAAALDTFAEPMLTTVAVLTEALFILGHRAGWRGQVALWDMIAHDDLHIAPLGKADLKRARHLMEKYRSLPMDFGDATMVTLAESVRQNRIFTLDCDFQVYRINGRTPFDTFP